MLVMQNLKKKFSQVKSTGCKGKKEIPLEKLFNFCTKGKIVREKKKQKWTWQKKGNLQHGDEEELSREVQRNFR